MELRSILKSTNVGEVAMTSRPTLGPGDTVAAAADEMRKQSHGSALICDDGRLVGIFTERDLLRVIATGVSLEAPLADVMTSEPRTVRLEDTLFDAMQLMDQGGYRRVPVVDADGAPTGFVDVKTIAHFLVGHFPEAIYNQASHAQSVTRTREGA